MAQHAEDVRAFRADGYVKLPPDLLAPEDLAELQRVYKREQAKWRAIRAEERERAMAEPDSSDSRAPGAGAWRSPGYFDFPWTPETDDVFKKLVCNERLVKIVESVIGDDVFLQDLRARTVIGLSEQREGDGTFGGRAYTGGFHHDGGQIGFADHDTLSHSVKLFFAISDQSIETGCTSVIPQTHRLGEGGWGESPGDSPRAAEYGLGSRGQDAAHGGGRSPQELDQVTGQDAFETPAGGSLLMDLRCWHTALPCRSDRDREGFILQYSPFSHKQEVLTRKAGLRMDAAGKLTTPLERQIMGVELQPSLAEPVPEPPAAEVRIAFDPASIDTPNLASPSFPEPPPAELQPTICSFRVDGFARVPQLVSGSALAEAQAAFAAATGGGSGQVSLVERIGEFLKVLALPALLDVSLLHRAVKLSYLFCSRSPWWAAAGGGADADPVRGPAAVRRPHRPHRPHLRRLAARLLAPGPRHRSARAALSTTAHGGRAQGIHSPAGSADAAGQLRAWLPPDGWCARGRIAEPVGSASRRRHARRRPHAL